MPFRALKKDPAKDDLPGDTFSLLQEVGLMTGDKAKVNQMLLIRQLHEGHAHFLTMGLFYLHKKGLLAGAQAQGIWLSMQSMLKI